MVGWSRRHSAGRAALGLACLDLLRQRLLGHGLVVEPLRDPLDLGRELEHGRVRGVVGCLLSLQVGYTRGVILESIRKTGHVLFVDEDVPGGTTAFMLQEVVEKQGGFQWLDSAPRTLAAQEHRPAFGSDGDHWSKPSRENIFELAYGLMHDTEPARFPLFYRP